MDNLWIWLLVGGFTPSEKYWSVGMIIPNLWENLKEKRNHQPAWYVLLFPTPDFTPGCITCMAKTWHVSVATCWNCLCSEKSAGSTTFDAFGP